MKLETQYFKILFICYLFFAGCSKNLSLQGEYEDLVLAEQFLEELLFDNGGCYTLFGDKPVTSILIIREQLPLPEFLSEELFSAIEFIESHTAENWDVWKGIFADLPCEHYFFVELPAPYDLHSLCVYFVNMRAFSQTLKRHHEKVQSLTNLSNLEEVLKKCREGDISCWHALLKDDFLVGMIFGYGIENVLEFCSGKQSLKFSDESIRGATSDHFPIPIFAVSDHDKTSERYRRDRERIKKLFSRKRILDVSMQRLCQK